MLALSADVVCAEGPVFPSEYWKSQAKKVRVGMTRKEVIALLPEYGAGSIDDPYYHYGGRGGAVSGGRKFSFHYVAPGWLVRGEYDSQGSKPDARGSLDFQQHPDNRLLAPIELTWDPRPGHSPTLVEPD